MLYAVAFLATSLLLGRIDFESDDDPWVTLGLIGLPLIVGFLIGRWWAITLPAVAVLTDFAIDPYTEDLVTWFAVGVNLVLFVTPAIVGVGARKAVHALRTRRGEREDAAVSVETGEE